MFLGLGPAEEQFTRALWEAKDGWRKGGARQAAEDT